MLSSKYPPHMLFFSPRLHLSVPPANIPQYIYSIWFSISITCSLRYSTYNRRNSSCRRVVFYSYISSHFNKLCVQHGHGPMLDTQKTAHSRKFREQAVIPLSGHQLPNFVIILFRRMDMVAICARVSDISGLIVL